MSRCRSSLHFHDRRAVASLARVGRTQPGNGGMFPQMISQSRPQPPGAVAVHDTETAGAGEKRAVERLLHVLDRLVEPAADDVDLGGGTAEIRGRVVRTRPPRRAGCDLLERGGSLELRPGDPHSLAPGFEPGIRPFDRDDDAVRLRPPDARAVSHGDLERAAVSLQARFRDRLGGALLFGAGEDARGRPAGAARRVGSDGLELRLDAAHEILLRLLEAGEARLEHPLAFPEDRFPLDGEALDLPSRGLPLASQARPGPSQPLERRLGLRFGAVTPLPGASQDLPRPADHVRRQPLLPGYGKRAAPSGETGVQSIVRPARLLVELHRRADRVVARRRETLD